MPRKYVPRPTRSKSGMKSRPKQSQKHPDKSKSKGKKKPGGGY